METLWTTLDRRFQEAHVQMCYNLFLNRAQPSTGLL